LWHPDCDSGVHTGEHTAITLKIILRRVLERIFKIISKFIEANIRFIFVYHEKLFKVLGGH
jgi:hypothetical protein